MSDVYLYVYDLSLGMAKKISKNIEGIWHTSIVAFEQEYWFALNGINKCNPSKYLSKTHDRIHLGKTELTVQEFNDLIVALIDKGSYVFGNYNLFTHNCNCFSNDLSLTLFCKPNPAYIMDIPKTAMLDLMNKPVIGRVFKPLYKRAAKPVESNIIHLKIPKSLHNSTIFGDTLVSIFIRKTSGNSFMDIVKEHFDENGFKCEIDDTEEEDHPA